MKPNVKTSPNLGLLSTNITTNSHMCVCVCVCVIKRTTLYTWFTYA